MSGGQEVPSQYLDKRSLLQELNVRDNTTFDNGQIQRSPLFFANIVKKDPGRAKQNSLATAGTNFTKPGAQNKGDLCMSEDFEDTK